MRALHGFVGGSGIYPELVRQCNYLVMVTRLFGGDLDEGAIWFLAR